MYVRTISLTLVTTTVIRIVRAVDNGSGKAEETTPLISYAILHCPCT